MVFYIITKKRIVRKGFTFCIIDIILVLA